MAAFNGKEVFIPMVLIHVVTTGETLTSIAAIYGVSVAALAASNQLPNPANLIPGQALVIPTPDLRYSVRPGDTLYLIAQTFGIGIASLADANNLADPNLIYPDQSLLIPAWEALTHSVAPGETLSGLAGFFGVPLSLILRVNTFADPDLIFPGQIVTIPIRGVERRPLTTNGFVFPLSLARARSLLALHGALLTYISIFDFPVDGSGGISVPNYAPLVQAARENGLATLATLTNFVNGNFSPELAHRVLADPAVRGRLIDRYLEILRTGGFAGAMVDFENMFPADRHLYTDFIAALASRLRPLGLVTAIAVAPKWADFPNAPWVGAFDYAALGRLVDFIYLMTYEWGWVGGPPGPVAPVNLVRRVLAYASSLVPPDRLMQGLPLYGYDWPLPDTPETLATTVDPQQALALAAAYGAEIAYDETAQTPTFLYRDSAGGAHEVWFEDARSVRAKYQATREFNLMGAGFWQLENDFPQNWLGLAEFFNIRKVALPRAGA